jgi:hypothetical protein
MSTFSGPYTVTGFPDWWYGRDMLGTYHDGAVFVIKGPSISIEIPIVDGQPLNIPSFVPEEIIKWIERWPETPIRTRVNST